MLYGQSVEPFYPTYEEWKPFSLSLLPNCSSILFILPMRNGNFSPVLPIDSLVSPFYPTYEEWKLMCFFKCP